MKSVDVSELRKEYTLQGLYRKNLSPNPFEEFRLWFEESVRTAGRPRTQRDDFGDSLTRRCAFCPCRASERLRRTGIDFFHEL